MFKLTRIGGNHSDKFINNFKSKIFHSFTDINFEYKVKTKTLKYSGSLCKSDVCKKIFKEFFNVPTMVGTDIFLSTVAFYEKEQIIMYSTIVGNQKRSYKEKIVNWSDEYPNVGTYDYITVHNNTEQKRLSSIYVDFGLDKHVTPTTLFTNCKYGVRQIKNYFSTTLLTKVEYKY